jgi:hypothetical protein
LNHKFVYAVGKIKTISSEVETWHTSAAAV